MSYDGKILIDSKIRTDGMEQGFELIKSGMKSVATQAKTMGNDINASMSKVDFSKTLAAAEYQVQQLEQKMSLVTEQFKTAVAGGDDESVAKLAPQLERLYDQVENARAKLAREIAYQAQKQAMAEEKAAAREKAAAERAAAAKEKAANREKAAAEKAAAAAEKAAAREAEAAEKAAAREIAAEEQAAAAKEREMQQAFKQATKPARRFATRFREIVSGALVFNLISAGLRGVTQYFGSALKSNDQFTNSLAKLKGALLTAFQPIYEVVLPALITLVNVLAAVASRVARFFALLSGKTVDQTAKAAENLYEEANAIKATGSAAEKAKRQLAGFDEINKLESTESASGGGGGGGSAGGAIAPDFDINADLAITEEKLNNILGIIGSITAALLTWKVLSFFGAGGGIALAAAAIVGLVVLIATCGDEIQALLQKLDDWLQGVFTRDWRETFGPVLGSILNGFMAAVKNIWDGVKLQCDGLIDFIRGSFTGDWDRALNGIVELIKGSVDTMNGILKAPFELGRKLGSEFAQKVLPDSWKRGINAVTEVMNRFISWVNRTLSFTIPPIEIAGKTIFSGGSVKLVNLPQIPYLAQGAVLPPNQPFLAMVGDQPHGTNIEAPLSTIQEAVRAEVTDMFGGMMSGFESVIARQERILAAIEGIEIGDDVIGKATERYNRSLAIMRGGL